jgi:hypothetical protein
MISLPSLHTLDRAQAARIWLATGATDIQEGACSLESRASELAMVLDGIDFSKLKRVPRYTRISEEKRKNIGVRNSQRLRL